jgi:C1A family cysteine protease
MQLDQGTEYKINTININGADSMTITVPKYNWKPAKAPIPNAVAYQPPAVAKLPTLIDLRAYASPVDDQGQLGSCTGNAIAGAIDLIDKKTQNKSLRVSRLFIYYQERVIEGDVSQDNGAYIRDGIKACNQYGAPLETVWPYLANKVTIRPSTAAYIDAAKRKVGSYQRITTQAAGIKASLNAGFTVVVGFTVYASFETGTWWQPSGTGQMPYPNVNTEQILGGHAVAIVGYNDAMTGSGGQTGYFIVRNSWGTGWGQSGYFYMPYSVINNANMSSDFWSVNSVSNP